MPERDAVTCNLGDGYELIAAGIRREKTGDLFADLMLKNGKVLYAAPGVLSTPEGRLTWATATASAAPDGPTAERMADALQAYVLLEALGRVQEEAPKKPTQADLLVGLVSDLADSLASDVAGEVELFHDPGGNPYATVPIGGHRETWPLHSKGFRQWMAQRYYTKHGKTPSTQSLVDATIVLAGKAVFDGAEHAVHVRVVEYGDTIYIDLCNERWEVAAIDALGWRIVANSPVKFRRTRGMLALPTPAQGGSIAALRRFINVPGCDACDTRDASSWILIVAWMIAALRGRGPYPVLNVLGEQGSAKSTLLRMLRALIDPNKAPIRSLPRDERDLMIATANSWCQAYDNLSQLQDWQSDALCRISTGGGFAARELYSDQDETILDAQRPLSLNGIDEVVTRNDLLDRSLNVYLEAIPEERRQPEKRLWQEFEQERPAILGALFDALNAALANEGSFTLDGHPRMADFAELIVAAEPALPWKPGAFLEAYQGNRRDANDLTLEASAAAQAVRDLMQKQSEPWIGTATDLLTALEDITTEKIRKQKSWPASGQALSNVLRRLAPNLRIAGVIVTFGRAGAGKRIIKIERVVEQASQASQASQTASGRRKSRDTSEQEASQQGQQASQASHQGEEASQQESAQRREKSAKSDACDTCDAEMPTHSFSGDFPEAAETEYGQASFGAPDDAVPTCQGCGNVTDTGRAWCFDCDPATR